MSERHLQHWTDELGEDDRAAIEPIRPVLARPGTWDGPPTTARQRLLDATADTETAPAWRRTWSPARTAAAAAAIAVAVTAGAVLWPRDVVGPTKYAVGGGPASPTASAVVAVEAEAGGMALTLEIEGLPGAEPGTYYAAWVVGDDAVVPVGSFHLREEGSIELWSGVDPAGHPRFMVTLQLVGAPPTPSDAVVLRGALGPTP